MRGAWLILAACVAALAVPAQADVVAHWSFTEGSGATAASSVGGWTGALVNFPDTSAGYGDPVGVAGWTSDGQLNFNRMSGEPGAARLDTDFPLSSLIGSSFTVEFIGTHNNPGQTWGPAIGQEGGCCFFFGKRSGSEQLHANINGIGSGDSLGVPIADGAAHHSALVFDDAANTLSYYFDYRKVGQINNLTGTLTDRGDLWIGSVAHQPVNEYWNGYLDEVRISNTALPVDQLLGYTPSAVRLNGVLAEWHFSEGSGTAANSSNGGWTGTLVNFTDTSAGAGDPVGTPGWTSNGMLNLNNATRIETNFPIADQLAGDPFTVEFIASHNNPTQNWSPLIGQSGGCCFFLGKQSGAEQLHYNFSGIGSTSGAVVDEFSDGEMHHYAAVFDPTAGTVELFFDYQSVGLFLNQGPWLADRGNLWIGGVAHQPTAEYWNGYVDFVRISRGALTPDQFYVPEPATLALLALGALTLLRRRRSA